MKTPKPLPPPPELTEGWCQKCEDDYHAVELQWDRLRDGDEGANDD